MVASFGCARDAIRVLRPELHTRCAEAVNRAVDHGDGASIRDTTDVLVRDPDCEIRSRRAPKVPRCQAVAKQISRFGVTSKSSDALMPRLRRTPGRRKTRARPVDNRH